MASKRSEGGLEAVHMGRILNIKNFNLYTGRYSRRGRHGRQQGAIAWEPEDLIHELIPVLAIRNREVDCESPLAWQSERNIRLGVEATLDSIIAWRAYRPHPAHRLHRPLTKAVPQALEQFQNTMRNHKLASIDGVLKRDIPTYAAIVVAMGEAVGTLSVLKARQANPMLGSKIMHFLLPEFFPAWDTGWVKNKALHGEEDAISRLGEWMPRSVEEALSRTPYANAAIEYARYVALMMKDLDDTDSKTYSRIEKAFIGRTKANSHVVWHHFHDLTPILFEVCLIGKHGR
jgi:hypothetical protein